MTNRGDTSGPGGGGQLHPRVPDPARGSGDEHTLADGEAALGEERVVGGGERLGKSARFGPAQMRRHGHGGAFVDDGELGLRTSTHHGHDAIADRETSRLPTRGDDLAGELHAGDVRR